MGDLVSQINLNTILIATGALIAGGGYAYASWRKGGAQAEGELDKNNKELIQTLTAQIVGYKEVIDGYKLKEIDWANDRNNLSKEIGRLSGLLEAQGKSIEDQRKIIENRNPDLEKALNSLVNVAELAVAAIKESREFQQEVRVALKIPAPETK